MNMYEFMFAAAFLILTVITLIKVYNLMSKGKIYDLRLSFILFVAFLIAWFTTLVLNLTMVNVVGTGEWIIFSMFFKLGSLLLIVNTLFLIIELFLNLGNFAGDYVESYRPAMNKGR